MEALWGSRSAVDADDIPERLGNGWKPRPAIDPPDAPEPAAPDSPNQADSLSLLRSELRSTMATMEARLTARMDELSTGSAQVVTRAAAVVPVAQKTEAQREDDLERARVERTAMRSQLGLTLAEQLSRVRTELSGELARRMAMLDGRQPEHQELIDGVKSESVTAVELDTIRAELHTEPVERVGGAREGAVEAADARVAGKRPGC